MMILHQLIQMLQLLVMQGNRPLISGVHLATLPTKQEFLNFHQVQNHGAVLLMMTVLFTHFRLTQLVKLPSLPLYQVEDLLMYTLGLKKIRIQT